MPRPLNCALLTVVKTNLTSSPLLVTRDSSAMRGTAYLPPSRHGVHSPLSNDLCRSRRFLCALARRQVASTSRLYSASFLPARPTLTPAFTSSEIVNFISIVVSRRINRLCEYHHARQDSANHANFKHSKLIYMALFTAQLLVPILY